MEQKLTIFYRAFLTLAGCCILVLCSAQGDEAAMEIGTKKMNLHVSQQPKAYKSKFTFSFVYDSMYEVKLPKNIWKSDTSTQIDPVSQEEVTVISVDSALRVHSYLGAVMKQEIIDAINKQFDLSGYTECKISSVDLLLITGAGSPVHIDYSHAEQLVEAEKQIGSLPKNSIIIISAINFNCPDNQGGMEDESFDNLAAVRISE